QGPLRHPVQRAYGGRRPDRLRPRLQDGTRRHRVEADGLDVSLRPIAGLAQNEELGCTGGEAGAVREDWSKERRGGGVSPGGRREKKLKPQNPNAKPPHRL